MRHESAHFFLQTKDKKLTNRKECQTEGNLIQQNLKEILKLNKILIQNRSMGLSLRRKLISHIDSGPLSKTY